MPEKLTTVTGLILAVQGAEPADRSWRGGFMAARLALSMLSEASSRAGIYFTSIEAARNLLTPNRLALLRAIRTKRPGSIYELEKITGRDLKNIQDDLRLLQRYGLVRIGHVYRSRFLGHTRGIST